MQALSAPFMLLAPALPAPGLKHEVALPNVRWQKLQEVPELFHSCQHHLPLAQLEGVQAVKQASDSVGLIQGTKATDVVIVGLGLLLVFWIGNYVVPDLIFSKNFKQEEGKQESSIDGRQRILDGLVGGGKDKSSRLPASSREILGPKEERTVRGTGFGKAFKRDSRNSKENE